MIVEHIDTGSLMFCPGSQISDRPLKDISHLMNEPQKFALIKLDKVRGNACVSRRQILSSNKKGDKIKIIEKYKVGDVIKNAAVKGYSSFGCFFDVNNGELDIFHNSTDLSNKLTNKLFSSDRYRRMYIAHMRTILNEQFANNNYSARANQLDRKSVV